MDLLASENTGYLEDDPFSPARIFDLDMLLAYNEFSVAIEATEENPGLATRLNPLATLFTFSI
jgi:hypothetical protein